MWTFKIAYRDLNSNKISGADLRYWCKKQYGLVNRGGWDVWGNAAWSKKHNALLSMIFIRVFTLDDALLFKLTWSEIIDD